MNRATAAAQIAPWLAAYLAETGRAATDTPNGLGPALDAGLRAMGVAAADLATAAPADDEGFRAQAEYHALRLIVRDLGANMAVSVDGDSYHLEQQRKHAEADLAEARAAVLELFGALNVATADGGLGAWDLNFLADEERVA